MTPQQIFAAIEEKSGNSGVSEWTPLDQLDLDSLDFAELLIELNIDVEKGGDFKTVGDIVAALA